MVPMFMVFRTRLYMAWILAECMCMTIGLGAYPSLSKPKCGMGPTDLKELHKRLVNFLFDLVTTDCNCVTVKII